MLSHLTIMTKWLLPFLCGHVVLEHCLVLKEPKEDLNGNNRIPTETVQNKWGHYVVLPVKQQKS
jgi:hypothetical protein